MLFVCHPKFCISFVVSFSWELKWPLEKLNTMLMQTFGVTNKEHYGMLWYFLEWLIALRRWDVRKRDLRGGRERYMRGGYNRRLQNWPVEQQLSDVSSTNDICAINHLWYLILDWQKMNFTFYGRVTFSTWFVLIYRQSMTMMFGRWTFSGCAHTLASYHRSLFCLVAASLTTSRTETTRAKWDEMK